jgi:hypothetical protein
VRSLALPDSPGLFLCLAFHLAPPGSRCRLCQFPHLPFAQILATVFAAFSANFAKKSTFQRYMHSIALHRFQMGLIPR